MTFLFDRFKRRSRLPAHATFRLSQEGVEKVKEGGGDPKIRILTALEARGTSNVDEISQTSGIRRGVVERLVPMLADSGYVQVVGGNQSFGNSQVEE